MRKGRGEGESVAPPGVLAALRTKVRPPVCVALGSPRQVAELVLALDLADCVAWQMDLHSNEL